MFKSKKIILLLTVTLSIFLLGGCGKTDEINNAQFEEEIDNSKNHNSQLVDNNDKLIVENKKLQEALQLADEKIAIQQDDINTLNEELTSNSYGAFSPSISYGYLGYNPDFYVLVQKETELKILPYDKAQYTNLIFENSLVRVLDKAQIQSNEEIRNDKYWYYVEITVYDTPQNTRGWIRAEETVPYTEENQYLVTSPISIKDGSKIYEESNPLDDDAEYILSKSDSGIIMEYLDEYVRVGAAGGREFWTKLENVVYPEIKPFME